MREPGKVMVHINVQGASGGPQQHSASGSLLQESSRETDHPQQCVAACSPQPSLFCCSPQPSLFSWCLVQSTTHFYEDGLCPIDAHLSCNAQSQLSLQKLAYSQLSS